MPKKGLRLRPYKPCHPRVISKFTVHDDSPRNMTHFTWFKFGAVALFTFTLAFIFHVSFLGPKESAADVRKLIVAYEDDWNRERCRLNASSAAAEPNHPRTWRKLNGTNIHLYSAFFDSRYRNPGTGSRSAFIRIIGMSTDDSIPEIFCHVTYAGNRLVRTSAEVQEIWLRSWDGGGGGRSFFKPFLFSCPLPRKFISVRPISVSVSTTKCPTDSSEHFALSHSNQRPKNFAICVKGLNFTQDVSGRLVEWLELQFLLGADSVTFYVIKVHPDTEKVLRFYAKSGKVKSVPLTLPDGYPSHQNVWQRRRHEIIQYNDCFYSYIQSHKFVVLLDLDEAIVPRKHTTWTELMDHVLQSRPETLTKYASISVPNVYFFDKFGPVQDPEIPDSAHMLRFVYRSANFSAPGKAVKSFFVTSTTLTVFNHYALSTLYKNVFGSCSVTAELAQLHHYRKDCPELMEHECQNNFMRYKVFDNTLWKWKKQLVANMREKISAINFHH